MGPLVLVPVGAHPLRPAADLSAPPVVALCSESQEWTVSPGLLPHLVTQSRDAEHFLTLLGDYEEWDHGWN